LAGFCISCGAALASGARFCGSCGAPVPGDDDGGSYGAPTAIMGAAPEAETSSTTKSELDGGIIADQKKGPNWLLIGGIAAILLLLLLYYLIFLRDDIATQAPAEKSVKSVEQTIEPVKFYAVAQANIRDRATTVDTNIIGKLARGVVAEGIIITGEDGTTSWLQLTDDKGFVATSNLSENQPPEIARALGDRIWKTDKAMDILTEANAGAPVYGRVAAGTPLTLFGLTTNGFVEIKLKKGGVGYLPDGARIAEASEAKGPPIAISFNAASCNFGGELEAEFAKLTAKSRAAYKAIEQTDFASDDARDKALVTFEGKSYYQRLERSFNGLSVTAIAQHYESQSVYFADAPDKVLAAFRAAGYKIGRDGQFANTEIYAGIGATAGEGRSFGRSDLSCGV
jgi:hypothetical protein